MKTKYMKIAFFYLSLILGVMISAQLNAQTKAKIVNVDFFAEGSKVVITYDIDGGQTGETFNIWIQVKTVSGKVLNAKNTSGDIGKGVAGGSGKRIEWNYTLDQVSLEEEVTIEVFASLEAAAPKTEETKVTTTPPATTTPVEKTTGGRNIHIGPALVMSAVLPGLGKTYIKGHGANWLLGVTGYGLVTCSVLLNHAAYNNLENYRASMNEDERDDFYKKAQVQAVGSYVFFTGAAIIWVVDFITTGVKAGKAKRNPGRVELNGGFEDRFGAPTIGITYKF